jgi:putative ABC transport system permease protein
MFSILKIASRNLFRYWRRTLLTAGLVTVGVVAVLMFVSLAGSFKTLMIAEITESYLGHLQVHRRGYVASIDMLPLDLNMKPDMVAKVEEALAKVDSVAVWSPRVKMPAMFSNFTETTSIRINGIDPGREMAASPRLLDRIVDGNPNGFLAKGEIQLPELLARGMKVKVGDNIVLVATNRDGSVNGRTFVVRGILASATGPGGRDGYIHIDDARQLLRLSAAEVSEIAVRLADVTTSAAVADRLAAILAPLEGGGPAGRSILEVHDWARLSPFANIARMIDLLIVAVRVLLVAIVLIAVMNVMIMAVYERIREIGTISAMGTPPRRILGLFVTEGLLLGVVGSVIGVAASILALWAINLGGLTFSFGQATNLRLAANLGPADVLITCGVVIVVAALASLQPAWKAAQMDPVSALRHV